METPASSTVYLQWKSPSRLFKKRDKEFFRNVGAIVFFILVILFFAKEFPLILAVLSITFLVYVFSTVPPEDIGHSLSTLGIETGGHFYKWDSLTEFWFETQWDQTMVVVVPQTGPRIMMLLGDIEKEKVKDVLGRFLRYREEPPKNLVDSAATWLSQKVPLEKTS
jgi:hypothetical protein